MTTNAAHISAQMKVCRRRGITHLTSADIDASLRRHPDRLRMRVGSIFIDAPFDLVAEMAKQPLHRPGGAVAEGADRVAFGLLGDLPRHGHRALVGAASGHARRNAPRPSHSLPARRARAPAPVLVTVPEPALRGPGAG